MKSVLGRLERAERLVKQTTLAPEVSIIWETMDGWRLDFRLGNGKPGGGRTVSSTHASVETAETAYNMLLTRYPEGRNTESVLIVMDV